MKRYIGCLLAGMFAMTPSVGAWTQGGELFPKPSVVPEFDLPYSDFADLVSSHKKRGCVAGTYVDGKREGFWLESWHGGGYAAGYYVDDKREGRWLEFWPPRTLPTWIERGQFGAGDFRQWVERSGGIVAEGRYEDGDRMDRWVLHRQEPRYGERCATIVFEWGEHKGTWQDGCVEY